MSPEAIRILIALGILVSLLIVAGLLVSIVLSDIRSRTGARAQRGPTGTELGESGMGEGPAFAGRPPDEASIARPYDRVFRIASWTFLLASAFIAAVSGLWPQALPGIVVLVTVTGGFVLLIHELLPARVPGSFRAILQALVAVGFATFLVVLTDGYKSPFFFAFPLIVGGAALVLEPLAVLVLVLLAAAGYLAGATVASGIPSSIQVTATAVNLIGLFVLTYIASAIGREQRRARDAALRLSALDSLTGLYNRPFFLAALEREIARSNRSGRGFCLVMLDLDDLKEVNDRYGHHAGDAVLRAVSETVRTGVRKVDVASRYAGDEFVALLPETDPTGGWVVAEKIRLGVRDQVIPGYEIRLTVSVGVVSYPGDGRTADALMISADRAMYASKRGGGNRVASTASEAVGSPGVPNR